MQAAYYNDNDAYCAQWLRNLIAAGEIPEGDVDERDIREVEPADLEGYGQIHLFAGLGGWSRALRLAGWGEDRPVWTASCPCPPFSVAGKKTTCPACASDLLVWCPRRTGYAICADCGHAWFADARHLWPEVWRLAAERRPEFILGEQVESVDAVNWLAGVRASMEILGYLVGAHDLPAASIGAPQIRQRLWWVAQSASDRGRADAGAIRSGEKTRLREAQGEDGRWPEQQIGGASDSGTDGRLARADGGNTSTEGLQRGGQHRQQPKDGGVAGGLAGAALVGQQQGRQDGRRGDRGGGAEQGAGPVRGGEAGGLGDTGRSGDERRGQPGEAHGEACPSEGETPQRQRGGDDLRSTGGPGFWSDFDLIPCGDGKARRVPKAQPGLQPLAARLPAAMDGLGPVSRVGTLRGAGNSIVPEIAAEWVRAVMEDRPCDG